jgi:hypothetical protein
VTDAIGKPIAAAEPGAARGSRWSRALRLGSEFALLFGIAVLAKQLLAAAIPGSYPNPLWLPVIVLSLQHGLAVGLAAAFVAAGLQYWDGLPPALMTEDMYAYIGRITAEPLGWTCVALLIGHIRGRQIIQTAELEEQLAESRQRSAAVADLCTELRARVQILERQIAANAQASNIDVAEAVSALQRATSDNLAEQLTRFVLLMTSAAEFAVYLLRDGALEVAFEPGDEHRRIDDGVAAGTPLFAAIANEQRILSAARPADAALLGHRGVMAGPLLDGHAPARVIGMLAIGGASLDDYPDDIERRFSVAASELSRLAGRIGLLDQWRAASLGPGQAAAGQLNGRAADRAGASPRAESAPAVGPAKGGREITLQ